jgi:hypothetical protein
MFRFIRHDAEFQGVLFRTAEDAKNLRFLESLSDYREQQRRAALPPVSPRIQQRSEFRRPPARPQRRSKPQHSLPPRSRQNLPVRPPARLPLDPKTLPPERVMRVSSAAFRDCPRCKIRLLAKVLQTIWSWRAHTEAELMVDRVTGVHLGLDNRMMDIGVRGDVCGRIGLTSKGM